jgi:hypothetical protein
MSTITPTAARLQAATVAVEAPLVYRCEVCSRPLEPVELSTGRHWTARGLAMRARRKHKSILCFDHYVAACRAVRRTVAVESVHPKPGWPERKKS